MCSTVASITHLRYIVASGIRLHIYHSAHRVGAWFMNKTCRVRRAQIKTIFKHFCLPQPHRCTQRRGWVKSVQRSTCCMFIQAMKQDYATALSRLPSLQSPDHSTLPTALQFAQSSTVQPSAYLPPQCSQAHKTGLSTHQDLHSLQPSAVPQTQLGFAPRAQQQAGHCMPVGQTRAAAPSSYLPLQQRPAHQNAHHCVVNDAADTVMQEASQPMPGDDICCAQQATEPHTAHLNFPDGMQPQHVDANRQHNTKQAHSDNCASLAGAPARSSIASAASMSSAGRVYNDIHTNQHDLGRASRPHWVSGTDRSSAVGHDSASAAVQCPTSSTVSAVPEKENAKPGTNL